MAKSKGSFIGSWAYLIGVILALILGLFDVMNPTWLYILIAVGIIIGLLNVADKEVQPFLMSGIILIIASALGQTVTAQVPRLEGMLQALLAIFVPATIIVAIKNVFSIARN